MFAGLGGWLAGVPTAGILRLMLDVSIKAGAVCAMAGLVTLLMRRSTAYARSMIWVFSLAVLLALPFAQLFPPIWDLPVLPEVGSWLRQGVQTRAFSIPGDKTLDTQDGLGGTPGGSSSSAPAMRGLVEGWHAWVLLVWAAGALLSLSWLLVRIALARKILRRCEKAGRAWKELLEEASAEIGLTRRVNLFESSEIGAAVTIGAINPAIVVPSGSSAWPDARRRYILSHELAHIKRWDGLIEVLALMVIGLYWMNPLIWLSVKALRVERERDCDDAVLNAGAKPSEYALFLMDIAAELGAPRAPEWRLSTISQGSNLKERIMSILDPKIDRNRSRRATWIVSCLLLASLVFPLSMSGIWQTQAQEQEESEKAKQEQALKKKEMELKKKEMELTKREMELKKAQLEKMSAEERATYEEMKALKKKALENMTEEEKAKFKEKLALKEKMAGMSGEEKIKLMWEKIEAEENSAAVVVHDAVVKKGPEAAMKIAQKLKEAGDDKYYFKESEFNTLGYLFLYDKKVDEALAVFNLNVEMNPDSWNVYDSLGEGCLAAGNVACAKKQYQKSLALNPESENGKKMLAMIEEHERTGEPIVGKE